MTTAATQPSGNPLINALNQAYMNDYPRETARQLELLSAEVGAELVSSLPITTLVPIWEHLAPLSAEQLAQELEPEMLAALLGRIAAGNAATLLASMPELRRETVLKKCESGLAKELQELLEFPEESAGRLMDTRLVAFNERMTVAEVLGTLRKQGLSAVSYLFLLDDDMRLSGEVDIHRLILADGSTQIAALKNPVRAQVAAMDHRDEVIEAFEEHRLEALAVVDLERRLVGVIHGRGLLDTVQEDLASDLQAMVGVSRDERAKSSSLFAVRRRLPWLCVNVFTAFLAASVVGMFEGTIAQFTALAILLPVAAGQSGNTGQQALAVTMRGLTLREITTRDWAQMLFKELGVGLINGVAIALLCGTAVYLWSHSYGLALVMGSAMVLSMTLACVAGTLVPIMLKRLGVDPATSSSIFLTTITDVAGFMFFLGIATLLSALLISS